MRRIKCIIGDTNHGRVKSSTGSILIDWEIYVDITEGDVDLLRKVVFGIKCGDKFFTHTSKCPTRSSGSNWRFQLRKRTKGPVQVYVKLIGYSRTITRKVKVRGMRGRRWSRPYSFHTSGKPKSLRPNGLPHLNFGIELELSTSADVSPGEVARVISSATFRDVKDLTHDYLQAKRCRTDIWRLVPDGSMSCPRGGECSMFELVSPILTGGRGLSEVDNVLKALSTISSVEVGKSMGYHVHVDVSHLSCNELVKVCQTFIKYERAMDSFMPPSRRQDVQEFCKSNEKAITASDPHTAIANCETYHELADIMNPGRDRYYKLNLQNLVTGRQPTIEFRQHSGSSNVSKIKNWIRFCLSFVHNSAQFDSPLPLEDGVDDDHLFEMLMVQVIDDRYLREYYLMRRNELHKDKAVEGEKGRCCEGCATRGRCAAKFLPPGVPLMY